jgi:hypothetical protein
VIIGDMVEKDRQRELLKVSYENIIRTALQNQNQNQNTYLYKKYIAFIGSFLQSVFLTWCSSGDTSYFPVLFKNNEIVRIMVCFLPFIGILIFEILIGISAIKIRKGIDYHFDMTMASWNKKLIKYILSEWETKQNVNIFQMTDIALINIKGKIKIEIDESDFSDYLREQYSHYKLDVYDDFYSHLAKVILLENEMSGIISYSDWKYIFILDNQTKSLLIGAY